MSVRPALQPESVVDLLLEIRGLVGDREVRTKEELEAAILSSIGREGSNTVWMAEDLEGEVRRWVEEPARA